MFSGFTHSNNNVLVLHSNDAFFNVLFFQIGHCIDHYKAKKRASKHSLNKLLRARTHARARAHAHTHTHTHTHTHRGGLHYEQRQNTMICKLSFCNYVGLSFGKGKKFSYVLRIYMRVTPKWFSQNVTLEWLVPLVFVMPSCCVAYTATL